MTRTHIRANRAWLSIDLRSIIQYRDLLWILAARDFIVFYKQSILGPLWFIIQPLATTAVFVVVFGYIGKIGTDGIPNILFFMSGTIFWTFFQHCMVKTSGSLISNAEIFKKVFFPRLIVPLSVVISSLGSLFLNLIILTSFYLYFILAKNIQVKPVYWAIIILPYLVIQCSALGLGVGLWVSALTVKYRDLNLAIPFVSQLWMFMTPVVYPVSEFPQKWRWLLKLNPMTTIMELTRHSLFGVETMWREFFLSGTFLTLIILISGMLIFNRVQKTFVDIV